MDIPRDAYIVVPPVSTAYWTADDWMDWIESNPPLIEVSEDVEYITDEDYPGL